MQLLRRRAALLVRRMFPPRAEIRQRYRLAPRAFVMPHYFRRLAKVFRRDAPTLLHAARHDTPTAALLDGAAYVASLRRFLTG